MTRTESPDLVFALPSKGRLMEDAIAYLAAAGVSVDRANGGRDYVGRLKELKAIEVRFLSAGEIAASLDQGTVHFGVTGMDLVYERALDADARVALLEPLGFGHANVVVAVPRTWLDVSTMHDLGDVCLTFRTRRDRPLRVATKYVTLTRGHFAAHGITDYRIVESLGATEGAPAAGAAEVIVDITSTGATLAANNLKILDDGVILRSEAYLGASLGARWDEPAKAAARELLDRIAGHTNADDLREVRSVVAIGRAVAEELAAELDARLMAGPGDTGKGGYTVFLCPEKRVYALGAKLRDVGAELVTVHAPTNVFMRAVPLYDTLAARLKA